MNSFRTPKSGKLADVADLVQKSLETLNEKIFSDPRMINLRDLISGSGVRSLGRITYSKRV